MRFFLFDRIEDGERGKYMRARKLVDLMDGYFNDHYPKQPVMPPTLIVEALAQLGGFLNSLNHDFAVGMVLMLVDGVHIHRKVFQGDILNLEVKMLYDHPYGATIQGEAFVDGQIAVSIERIVYAHEITEDPMKIQTNKARFDYQGGSFLMDRSELQ